MAVVKRISALVALLVIPAGLAWAGQALGGNAGSPDVGNASITVSVEPSDDADRRNDVENPATTSPSETPVPPAGASEAPVVTESGTAPTPGVTGAPAVPPVANTPTPSSPPISDVQRQPIPAPQQQWDDDWDNDDRDDDGGDDDWDDDADEGDDWDDDGE
jgi:hypothetical protein